MADHDSVAATPLRDDSDNYDYITINVYTMHQYRELISYPISIASLVMGALIAALFIVIVVLYCCLRSCYKRYRKLISESEGGVPLEDKNRSNEGDHRTDHNNRRTDQHNKT